MATTTSALVAGQTGAPDPFRWADVPAVARDWLRKRTEDIIGLTYRQACDAVRIGIALNEAKAKLRHGEFAGWVESQLPFSLTTANRYRQVAAAFADFATTQFGLFDESALYVLAELRTPQAARTHAVQLVATGTRVTHAVALEIIDAHRPVAVSERESVEYEKMRNKLDARKSEDDRGKVKEVDQDKVTNFKEQQDELRRVKIGRAMEELAARATLVRVEKIDDAEDVVLYSVTCHFPDDGPRNVVDRHLMRALMQANGTIETKYCAGCETDHPTEQFGDNDNFLDGLMSRCKNCERGRKKVRREKKKAAKRAASSPAVRAQPPSP